jgi:alpha-aminoadipic semialdehyde synthase
MAHYHLEQGIASPFLYTPRPHNSSSLKHAQQQLKAIGKLIAEHGTPEPLGPFVIGVTGSGNVSKGCLDMLKELPLNYVSVDQLEALVKNPGAHKSPLFKARILTCVQIPTVERY